jgi:TATA-binding protein-associated factor Taf7
MKRVFKCRGPGLEGKMDSWDVQYSPSYGVALYLHAQEEEEEEEEDEEDEDEEDEDEEDEDEDNHCIVAACTVPAARGER